MPTDTGIITNATPNRKITAEQPESLPAIMVLRSVQISPATELTIAATTVMSKGVGMNHHAVSEPMAVPRKQQRPVVPHVVAAASDLFVTEATLQMVV